MLDLIITAGVGITGTLIGVAMGAGLVRSIEQAEGLSANEGSSAGPQGETHRLAVIAEQRLDRIIDLENSCAAYKANNTRMKARIAELVKLLEQYAPTESEPGQLELSAPARAEVVPQ